MSDIGASGGVLSRLGLRWSQGERRRQSPIFVFDGYTEVGISEHTPDSLRQGTEPGFKTGLAPSHHPLTHIPLPLTFQSLLGWVTYLCPPSLYNFSLWLFIYLVAMCWVCVLWCTHGDRRTHCINLFSPPTMWVLGVELRSPGLMGSTFIT